MLTILLYCRSAPAVPPPKPAKLVSPTYPLPPSNKTSFAPSTIERSPISSLASNPFVTASNSSNNSSSNTSASTAPHWKPTSNSVHQSHTSLSGSVGNLSGSSDGIDVRALAEKYTYFSTSEVSAFHQHFIAVDNEGKGNLHAVFCCRWAYWIQIFFYSDNQGSIHQSDLSSLAPKTGESVQNVTAKLASLRLVSSTGDVTFESFLKVLISFLQSFINLANFTCF